MPDTLGRKSDTERGLLSNMWSRVSMAESQDGKESQKADVITPPFREIDVL